ncbi:hypothetical protein LPJ61_001878 [Coemansia biformis]|uniref:HMG box domain-containing protein n=1 Tax=Coemansia biformis TaxID=1286918 RepID=A0A9W8CZ66_9FUNG|nr:hypothetical protein LPJ61_001878 [Coemansia biformis]
MPDGQTQNSRLAALNGPLTSAEMDLVHQLRGLSLKRAESTPEVDRVNNLDIITYSGRRYLEIFEGISPILVPTPMLESVRESIRQNLEMRLHVVPTQRATSQLYSPPRSPGYSGPVAHHSLNGPPEIASAQPQPTRSSLLPEGFAQSSPYISGVQALPQPMSPQQVYIHRPWDLNPAPHSGSGTTSSLLAAGSSPPNSFSTTPPLPPPSPPQPVASLLLGAPGATGSFSVATGQCGRQPKPPATPDMPERGLAKKSTKATQPRRNKRLLDDDAAAPARGRAASGRAGRGSVEAACCQDDDNDDDDDGSRFLGGSSDEDESDGSELRKPLNCFMLYRRQMNAQLRKENPALSVEAASGIIKDLWKNESTEVKDMYREQSSQERNEYFAKKKRMLARQKRRKSEREDQAISRRTRTRKPSGECKQVTFSGTRQLSSLAPGALPQSSLHADGFAAMPAHPPGSTHSLTLNTSSQLGRGSPATTLMPSVGHLTAEINCQVASSLEQLQASFSQTLCHQQSPLNAMALDSPAVSMATLQSLTAPSSSIGSTSGMDWATAQAQGHDTLSGVLSSWFREGS